MLELEKNLMAYRLKDGRKRAQDKAITEIKRIKRIGKRLKPGMLTQAGKPKAIGSKSWLTKFGQPNPTQCAQLKSAFKARQNGEFGWRALRDDINKALKTKLKSHEVAMRLCNEFSMYFHT